LEVTSAIWDALAAGNGPEHADRLTAAALIAILNTANKTAGSSIMTEPANGRCENFGRRIDEHFGGCSDRLEDDVKKVITYLNDRVVPEVRDNSSKALRIAAEQLARLADHLDRSRKA
jgi:hypothetical protein